MTIVRTVTHYANTAHGQPNANDPSAYKRSNWTNAQNASASDVTKAPAGSAKAQYQNNSLALTRHPLLVPWTFTGATFNFDIPDCAYIRSIKFEVPIKLSDKASIPSPQARFNFYNGTKSISNTIKNGTGWYGGYYYHASNHANLTTSWATHTYTMSGDEFRKRGYPNSECGAVRFGIDLRWQDFKKLSKTTIDVYVKYVKCIIEYELPDESITLDRVTSGDNPRLTTCGEPYEVTMEYYNRSNAHCCGNVIKKFKLNLPPNAKILEANVWDYTQGTIPHDPFDFETQEWSVACVANAHSKLKVKILDFGSGLDKINLHEQLPNGRNWDYYVYSMPNSVDVGDVTGYAGTMQKDVTSCLSFESKVNASDGYADYYIDVSYAGGTSHTGTLENVGEIKWTINKEKSSQGVSIDGSPTGNHVRVTVPRDEYVDVAFKGCFKPISLGEKYATYRLDNGATKYIDYNVINAPVYIIRNKPKLDEFDRSTEEVTLNPSIITFRTHRVASSTEIGAYVIDCGVADFDENMIEDDCTLSANVWEKLDYIGCVPLEYHHYDPESTYSNKGISESYKNKTYKGKEGVIDEDISLKFKVRPKKVPELQGLVKLDKPTPINANWRCFEGDPLNHRGWVVLSEIKTKRTNPLWYDCEAKVDYITHDINTKFQIFKELQVNTQALPELMAETYELGGNLSTALDIFRIDTDGGFIYDEDGQDGAKNLFSLDEGQHLDISTVNPLANVSQIRFDWYSTKIREIRENTIQRIFRLKDADGNAVLEYEYANFQYYEDYTTCDVIVRVKTLGESWQTQIYNSMDLRTEIEADPIADDGGDSPEEIVIIDDDTTYYKLVMEIINNEEVPTYVEITESDYDGDRYIYDDTTQTYVLLQGDDDDNEVAYDPQFIAPTFDPDKYDITTVYGTSVEFLINGNKLKIYDSGYNGREIAIEDIELLKSTSYTFESYWVNNNVDGTTEDVLSYIDIGLSETIIDTQYSQTYNNLMVSPFPIPYKTVVFTRESEEGTIFYLTGDEPFKYRIEPFYQYHCGCDLVTREGVSIFDLNNSYTYFYIENGLIRLGFNKFNGRLYLAKWDIVSKSWVTTHYFHMSNDVKFSLETYSDDKMVIKAGTDTFFTIWRGHPFIGIKNPNDEIFIDTTFNYCLSDKVEGQPCDYPIVHSFMNTNNKLPECIGGTKLDYDCICVDDDEISPGHEYTITLNVPSENPVAQEETTLYVNLSDYSADSSVHYIINNIDVATVEAPFNLDYTFMESGAYEVQAVYVGDDDDDIAISNKITVQVETPPEREESQIHDKPEHTIPGEYRLRVISAPSKFTYKDGKQVVLQLTKGSTPLPGYLVELQRPDGVTQSVETDEEGKVSIKNVDYPAGRYQWGGRFYDSDDTDHNRRLIESAFKWITIEKATPKFRDNSADGKVTKGHYLHVWLDGVSSVLKNQNIAYTIGKGSKTTKKTNDSGKIYIKFNQIGTFKIKLMYAGNKNYKAISKPFTIKVVK